QRDTHLLSKKDVKRLDREKKGVPVSCPAWPRMHLYAELRTRFPDAGKRTLVLINSMLSLSSGLPGRAQEPSEKAIPLLALPAQKKALTEATSTRRERHEYWLYAWEGTRFLVVCFVFRCWRAMNNSGNLVTLKWTKIGGWVKATLPALGGV